MFQIRSLSGPYFSAFGLNTIRMWENTDQKKLRIWTLFTQCLGIEVIDYTLLMKAQLYTQAGFQN